ncbi:MAG: 1-acyl-sn-glycerol-3-phosphate acyltransferase [Porphyromonas sp.]|nr:1-acyl-sn-glycerol-3-phosphate acyltransferase [Porphyromonas sp.]
MNNSKTKKNFAGRLLSRIGWTPIFPTEAPDRSVICVAPHTSNWDFIIGYLYYKAWGTGLTPRFLIKKEWFVFPFNLLFKRLGGLPVDRKSGRSSVDQAIAMLKSSDKLHIGITPEGTRKRREQWKSGFYRIAKGADVPIQLAKIDYKNKAVGIIHTLRADNPDINEAIREIRSYFDSSMAKYPDHFADLEV